MERIILGSADVYIQAFDGSTVPVTADICKPGKFNGLYFRRRVRGIQTFFLHRKGRHWKKSKTIVTEEEVTLENRE